MLVYLVLPAALIAWVAYGRPALRLLWWARALLAASWLAAIMLFDGWSLVSHYWRVVWPLLLIGAIAWRVPGLGRLAPWRHSGHGAHLRMVIYVFFIVTLGLVVTYGLSGYRPPGPPVRLAFPLGEGVYVAGDAGANVMLNAHRNVLFDPRLKDAGGQAHGVDLVALDWAGVHAWGGHPQDLRRYAIYGRPVYAPCSGTVARAKGSVPDRTPPAERNLADKGNHVVIACRGVHVVLGHLAQGSLVVAAGDTVAAGDRLARVGNSGPSVAPHLHIHAQEPAGGAAFMDAAPVPIALDGRYLVQGALAFR